MMPVKVELEPLFEGFNKSDINAAFECHKDIVAFEKKQEVNLECFVAVEKKLYDISECMPYYANIESDKKITHSNDHNVDTFDSNNNTDCTKDCQSKYFLSNSVNNDKPLKESFLDISQRTEETSSKYFFQNKNEGCQEKSASNKFTFPILNEALLGSFNDFEITISKYFDKELETKEESDHTNLVDRIRQIQLTTEVEAKRCKNNNVSTSKYFQHNKNNSLRCIYKTPAEDENLMLKNIVVVLDKEEVDRRMKNDLKLETNPMIHASVNIGFDVVPICDKNHSESPNETVSPNKLTGFENKEEMIIGDNENATDIGFDLSEYETKLKLEKEENCHIDLYKETVMDASKLQVVLKNIDIKDANDYEERYFNLVKKLTIGMKSQWIPPRSPHNLIEEVLYHDPWALLAATIFLNKTSCGNARPYIFWFLYENPHPMVVLNKLPEDLFKYFVKLGLQNTRATQLWRMSKEFVLKDWKNVTELYGVGRYAGDAYRMFCLGDFNEEPNDRFLKIYRAWYQKLGRKTNE